MEGGLCKILCVLFLICGVVQAFYVNGNTLYDSNGNPVLLRGIARPSLEWNEQGQYISLSDYTLMKNWGANVVRLSLNQCYWRGSSGAAYQATVQQSVQWIKSLGMAVILDLHWSNGAQAGCYQKSMPDVNSVDFWTSVATKYRNDPVILFELYNEPYTTSWTVWQQGGTEMDSGQSFQAVGFQTLYNTVRATGANNTVIISGIYWAYDLSGVPTHPIVGHNIMFNTHPYNTDDRPKSGWDAKFGFIASTYPLIATEFGDFRYCTTQFSQDFIDYCNSKSISWTAWGWWKQGCDFPSIISEWDGTPSAPGVVVKYDLQHTNKVPGNATIIPTIATYGTIASTGTTGTTGNGGGTTGNAGTTGTPSGTGINVTIFSDGLQNGFADYSWADNKNAADPNKYQGSVSYSWSTGGFKAMYFVKRGAIDTSAYMGVEFYVNGGSSGGQQIAFNVLQTPAVGDAVKKGPDGLYISNYIGGPIPANKWVKGFVDFSHFASGTWDGIWFQSSSDAAGTVYFDNIALIAYPPATPTTSQSTTSQSSSTSQSTSSQSTSSQSTSSQSTSSQSTSSQATSSQSTSSKSTTSKSTTATQSGTTAATNAATTAAPCDIGTLRCPCSSGGSCASADLTCLSGVCVRAGDAIRNSASLAFSLFSLAFASLAGIFAIVF